jgi:hypothetical protein
LPEDRRGVVVDVFCQAVALLDEELSQFDVVDDPAWPGELVPEVGSAAAPVLADRFGLAGLDRAGCEARLALGDVSPDEGGCFLPLAVIEDWLLVY